MGEHPLVMLELKLAVSCALVTVAHKNTIHTHRKGDNLFITISKNVLANEA
jgi:hypothetical protein